MASRGTGRSGSHDIHAVQTAIGARHRDRGGTVLVPAGVFPIGTLLGSADGKQYRAADAIPLSGVKLRG